MIMEHMRHMPPRCLAFGQSPARARARPPPPLLLLLPSRLKWRHDPGGRGGGGCHDRDDARLAFGVVLSCIGDVCGRRTTFSHGWVVPSPAPRHHSSRSRAMRRRDTYLRRGHDAGAGDGGEARGEGVAAAFTPNPSGAEEEAGSGSARIRATPAAAPATLSKSS